MGKLINIVSKLHQSTKRDYLKRMVDDKIECMKISKKYEKEYWDGNRRYGIKTCNSKFKGHEEGIKTLKVVWEESRKQKVEMPIVEALYKIIFEEEPLGNSMEKVLGTNQGKDVEFSRKV